MSQPGCWSGGKSKECNGMFGYIDTKHIANRKQKRLWFNYSRPPGSMFAMISP